MSCWILSDEGPPCHGSIPNGSAATLLSVAEFAIGRNAQARADGEPGGHAPDQQRALRPLPMFVFGPRRFVRASRPAGSGEDSGC